MNDFHIENALKHIREEQERAAQRVLQKRALELLKKETPRGTGMHLRLAQDFGLLFRAQTKTEQKMNAHYDERAVRLGQQRRMREAEEKMAKWKQQAPNSGPRHSITLTSCTCLKRPKPI